MNYEDLIVTAIIKQAQERELEKIAVNYGKILQGVGAAGLVGGAGYAGARGLGVTNEAIQEYASEAGNKIKGVYNAGVKKVKGLLPGEADEQPKSDRNYEERPKLDNGDSRISEAEKYNANRAQEQAKRLAAHHPSLTHNFTAPGVDNSPFARPPHFDTNKYLTLQEKFDRKTIPESGKVYPQSKVRRSGTGQEIQAAQAAQAAQADQAAHVAKLQRKFDFDEGFSLSRWLKNK